MKSKGIAIPYVVWMAVFVVAPLIVVVVYAFTNRDWTVTLDHFNTLGQYAGVFGRDKKWKVLCGVLLAIFLRFMGQMLSGVVFFSQNAWDGWGAWGYSITYHLSCIDFILREDKEFTAILQFVDSISKSGSAFHGNHRTIGTTFDFSFVWLVFFKTVCHNSFTGRGGQHIGTKTDDPT